MRTIRITGTGRLYVKPDTTVISITLSGVFPEYSETLRRSSEDTEAIQEIFSGFGFEKTDLKTQNFDVNTQYESCNENGTYRQRFAGYRFYHSLRVEFDSDNEKLGRILYALANSPVDPEFTISYTVKDKEKPKAELLEAAIGDARIKAGIIAGSAGVTLKRIQRIDYSSSDISFAVAPMGKMAALRECNSAGSYDMNINPEDIALSENVSIIWEIE